MVKVTVLDDTDVMANGLFPSCTIWSMPSSPGHLLLCKLSCYFCGQNHLMTGGKHSSTWYIKPWKKGLMEKLLPSPYCSKEGSHKNHPFHHLRGFSLLSRVVHMFVCSLNLWTTKLTFIGFVVNVMPLVLTQKTRTIWTVTCNLFSVANSTVLMKDSV